MSNETTSRDRPPLAIEQRLQIDATSQAARLVELIHFYQTESANGTNHDPIEWAAKYPEFAEPLERALKGIDEIRRAADSSNIRREIGDFRIIREIGRGGMGAVFEAEQKSLGRRVALKVLWFGTAHDVSAIQRFQREAETVAQLHHTHIVPIYSVGTDGPINYFAMQLIDGQSLDQVIKQHARGLDANTVATWGLQAAEALTHAHHRGVIHRDVKPSNLLLDRSGQLWLTDFGLAKRSDDVTLSMAGVLMGTPRYMSPEQASASTHEVDHRSDIYSLGATLYEAITGQPVHNASTPHGVISQILSEEIVSPRKLRSDIPRDIETVLMKCLDKTPASRYASAADLASDLRAILESRPIQARRISLFEQTQKWLTRHQTNVKWTTLGVGATLGLILVSLLGWYVYDALHASYLTIESAEGNLIVEVFDSESWAVTQPLAIPMQAPVTLPDGDYQVRLSAAGYLSQDAQVTLSRQQTQKVATDMGQDLAFKPIDAVFGVQFVQGDSQTLQVTYDEHQLRINRNNGPEHTLPWTSFAEASKLPGWIWPINKLAVGNSKFGLFELRPWILPHGEDLNSDGATDFVIAFRHQGCVAACGTDGWFWIHGPTEDLESASLGGTSETSVSRGMRSTIVQSPEWIRDIDGDGTRDLLVSFADAGMESRDTLIREGRLSAATQRWVEVVSGATGQSLWRFDIPNAMFETTNTSQTSAYSRWYMGPYRSSMNSSNTSMLSDQRITRRSGSRSQQPTEPSVEVPVVKVGEFAGLSIVIVATCSQLQIIDIEQGSPLSEPVKTGVIGSRPMLVADLNGDKHSDLLLTHQVDGSNPAQDQILAWSIVDQKTLWTHTVDRAAHNQAIEQLPVIGQLADLDADGFPELLVPARTTRDMNSSRYSWGELETISGASGQVRWSARIYSCDAAADQLVVGPDVDGDQIRDVFVASQWGNCDQLVAECHSGKDGSLVWIQSHPILQNGSSYYVTQPILWNSGDDGWPQLVVTLDSTSHDDLLVLFSTRDGHVTHTTSGFDEIRLTDSDGDRVDDLCLIENHSRGRATISSGLKLTGIRGVAQETIRQLGVSQLLDGTDFDNDGVQDILWIDGDTVVAKSPVDGRTIWKIPQITTNNNARVVCWESLGAQTESKSLWDFNQDGVRDMVLERGESNSGVSFFAISGKSGRTLFELDFVSQSQQGKATIEVHDIDHDGQAEIVAYGFSDAGIDRHGGYDSAQGRMSLTVYSSTSGQSLWRSVMSREFGGPDNALLPFEFPANSRVDLLVSDQNGDGIEDIIAFAEAATANAAANALELRCCNGRDGSIIWHRAVHALANQVEQVFSRAPSLASMPSESTSPDTVLLLQLEQDAASEPILALHCLNNAGQSMWSYQFETTLGFNNYSDQQEFRSSPIVLRNRAGKCRIACNVPVQAQPRAHLVVLEEDGTKVGDITTEDQNFPINFSIFRVDTDFAADSASAETAIIWGKRNWESTLLHAEVWDDVKLVREYTLPKTDSTYADVSIRPRRNVAGKQLHELICTDAPGCRATGVDLNTGNKTWVCLGPNAEHFNFPALSARTLCNVDSADPSANPLVVFHSGDLATCRTGRRVFEPIENAQRIGGKSNEVVADFRIARLLPGVERMRGEMQSGIWKSIAIGVVSSLVLVIAPWCFVRALIHRRRWGVRSQLLAFVIVAFMLAYSLSPLPREAMHDGKSTANLLFWSVWAAPICVFTFAIIGSLWNRNFVLTIFFVAMTIMVSIAWATLRPEFASNSISPPEPGEQLSFESWYLLLLPGIVAISYTYLALRTIAWCLRPWQVELLAIRSCTCTVIGFVCPELVFRQRKNPSRIRNISRTGKI